MIHIRYKDTNKDAKRKAIENFERHIGGVDADKFCNFNSY